jgi:hypothetical protein
LILNAVSVGHRADLENLRLAAMRHNVLFQRKSRLFGLDPGVIRGVGKPLIVGFGGRSNFALKFRNRIGVHGGPSKQNISSSNSNPSPQWKAARTQEQSRLASYIRKSIGRQAPQWSIIASKEFHAQEDRSSE